MSASRGAGAQQAPTLPDLITALPGDHTRAPQNEFTRARQVQFLDNLSITGSVRSAAAAAGVSHQTAYRARRATGGFRTAWDAALVVARANAEATLACRAIDGVEEEIRYHGEVVGTRIRFSDRLLLAHLARLDKLAETPSAAAAFADDFEAALARFERGDAEPEISSPGPCNTRSMSPYDCEAEAGDDDLDEGEGDDRDRKDDYGIDWEDMEASQAALDRIKAEMEAERPADAPRLDADDPDGPIADAQWEAFMRKIPRWWLIVEAKYGDVGEWRYAEAEADPDPETETGAEAEPALPPAPGGESERSNGGGPGPDSEPKPEVKSEPEQEAEHEFEPQPAPQPEPEPDEAPASPPAGTPRDDRPRWTWSPVNDGRLQPFYGRYL